MWRHVVLLFGFAWLAVACTRSEDPARELEQRILAPCCYRQALADHSSPLASELRAEIEGRVAAGEPVERIEEDLVRRYGAQVRVEEPGNLAPALIVVAALLVGAAVVLVIRRNRREAARLAPRAAPADERAYGDRLDDELAAID